MDDDDETWLTPGLSSAPKDNSSSSSKGTQSDLDSWLSTTSSAIDFSTRSALSRRLKGYSEKKARRRQLRSASTISLESVSEESSPRKQSSVDEKEEEGDTTTLPCSPPIAHSSPLVKELDRSRSLGYDSIDSPYGGDEDEEYKKLEEEALGLSIQSEEEEGEQREVETTQEEEEDEFLSAASEFEDEELEAAHHNGRSRELESLDEEPARVARQQVLGARLGVTPRSSSVSPRLAATVHPTSTPKAAVPRVERVSADVYSTPVGTLNTLPRRPTVEANKGGTMSVSLHMPSGHLPPRRIPPGRGVENGKSPLGGGGGGGKDGEKKVNLHEDLAKIQDVAREQEEALRREVMGSLSANDVSNGENDSRLITNSKSVEFVGKKEFHSRLPTPSRRVIPVKTRGGPPTTNAALPLRAAPSSVGSGCSNGGGISEVSISRPTSRQNGQPEDDCF